MATYTITALDAAKAEGDEGVTIFRFAIDRAGPFKPGVTYETVHLKLDSTDFDAFDGVEFNPADGRIGGNNNTRLSVAFSPGQTQAIISIAVRGDLLVELDEVLVLSLKGYHEVTVDDAGQGAVDAFAINGSAVAVVQNDDGAAEHMADEFHADIVLEDGVVSPEEQNFILDVPDSIDLFNQLFDRMFDNLFLMSNDGEFDGAEVLAMDSVYLGNGLDEDYVLARDQEIARAEDYDPPAETSVLAYLEASGFLEGLGDVPDADELIENIYLSGGHVDLNGESLSFVGDIVPLDLSYADIVDSAAGQLHQVTLANGHSFYLDGEGVALLDGELRFDVERGGNAGMAYRIYQAAFDRNPDLGGLEFWINLIDGGTSLGSVSAGFIASSEFAEIYGTDVSDLEFVSRLYQNVLGRDGEQAGIEFWTEYLQNHVDGRAAVLAGFSESIENVTGVAPAIQGGIFLPEA